MRRFAAAVLLASASLAVHAQAPSAASDRASANNSASNSAAALKAVPNIENAVVKVFSTLRRPDPFKPWSKAAPQEVSGSGVVIEGKRILTNAHVVGYASQVQIQASEAGDKVSATVVAIGRGIDLAILKLDDETFFDNHPPVARASLLPEVRDAVFAYGYPTGGNSLSITKGIVSRIEFVGYSFASAGLRIQIDAAINPGNSGGPVIAGDKMVGLAFAGASNAQNIGYIIPNEEVELFLRDVADGKYNGKASMQDDMQTLENPALRSYLALDKSIEGALVQHPYQSDAAYPLKEWDLITRIGTYPIDNQGMVKLGANLRVRFQYRVQQLVRDGHVPLTIVRGGKQMAIALPVGAARKLLIAELNGSYPAYFIYGPIVFSRASPEFLSAITANAALMQALAFNASPLMTRLGESPDAAREELVVISSPFFPHKLVSGYNNRMGSVIDSINQVPVRSLRHLVTLLRDMQDELVVIRFDQRAGESIVLPRKAMLEATDAVLSDNGIRQQGSQDMLDVWTGKAGKADKTDK